MISVVKSNVRQVLDSKNGLAKYPIYSLLTRSDYWANWKFEKEQKKLDDNYLNNQ